MIAIVDYGAGNLRSVFKALAWLGYPAKVTASPTEILAADGVLLPGVGSAGDFMRSLEARGLTETLRQVVAAGRPFFGVCLGLQVLLTTSEEDGGQRCLDLVPGQVKRLPSGLKVPHMGWNQVRQKRPHPLFQGIPDGANFYFVHSYYAQPEDSSLVIGETEYGLPFCSVLTRGHLVATQFHPEKSGEIGLQLYQNFFSHFVRHS